MRVTVLGAGYMGSAMATHAVSRGHDVTLWGTWLDDPMLDPVERGEPHPRLKLKLAGMKTMRAAQLAEALAGAELVIFAANSDGAVPVMTKAGPHLPNVPVLSVAKGFLESAQKKMVRVDQAMAEAIGRPLRYVHAAGPAKAMEIARGVLTWMTFAGPEADAKVCREALGRGDTHLQVTVTTDLAGAEVCSALKNAYATGLGMWDGLIGVDAHNARAACFTQSLVEMRRAAIAAGGSRETVDGAAGVGDLHVTGAGGRNRVFGERIGRGRPGREVAEEMGAAGELTEGYMAIKSGMRFVREHGVTETPWLDAIHEIVWNEAAVEPTLRALKLSV